MTALKIPRARLPIWASIATAGISTAAIGMVAASVAWATIRSGQGASAAGIASFGIRLPAVLGLALGGRIVERFGPRPVLVASNWLTVVGVAAAALAADVGLIAVVALLGLANLIGAPGNVAQDGRLRELARLARMPLERATGIRNLVTNLAFATGPALGVGLVGLGGLPAALAGAAALLTLAAAADTLAFPAFPPRTPAGRPVKKSISGFTHLAADRALLALTCLGLMLISAFAALDDIVAPSAAAASGLGSGRLALFLWLNGGAALLGGLLFAAYGDRLPGRTVLIATVALIAMGFVTLAALPAPTAFLIAPLLIGLGIGPLAPLVDTALQRRLPRAVRASVLGAFSATILIAQPVAALCAGPLVDGIGLEPMLWVLSAFAGSALLMSFALPSLAGVFQDRQVTAARMRLQAPSEATEDRRPSRPT